MTRCLFVSDLHGRARRYERLFAVIAAERPAAVFLGGDLLPFGDQDAFAAETLKAGFATLSAALAAAYPRVFLILGNDDRRSLEPALLAATGLWEYLHMRHSALGNHRIYGYACVPPTPFRLKDFERYDVSRFVDPGAIPPEEGSHSVALPEHELRHGTIQDDLGRLTGEDDLARAVLLCHAPPYGGRLDRAALDGKSVEHAPLDVHVGSIALRRLIEARQPLLTLHGHVHESACLTGAWRERIGRSHCFSAAHDGEELALVRFDLEDLEAASRELL